MKFARGFLLIKDTTIFPVHYAPLPANHSAKLPSPADNGVSLPKIDHQMSLPPTPTVQIIVPHIQAVPSQTPAHLAHHVPSQTPAHLVHHGHHSTAASDNFCNCDCNCARPGARGARA